MSCTYIINSKTSNIWKNFFDNLTGSRHPALNINTDDRFNLLLENTLGELSAKPIFEKTVTGKQYIKGAVFESSQDLLHFKLKFN